MKLKCTFSCFLFILTFLLLVPCVGLDGKDPEAYWEKKMKALPMPELIKDLSDADGGLFVRDFDMKPNAMIYHNHVVSNDNKNEKEKEKKKETFVKKLEPEKLFREEEEVGSGN